MPTGPNMQRCQTCGQEWWGSHSCHLKQTAALPVVPSPGMTFIIGQPVADPRDAEIARLRAALAIVREYPDFDAGGALPEMIDQVLGGKPAPMLDALDRLGLGA